MKPIHVLIDGADKRGKTTQCLLLSEKLFAPYIKMPNMSKYIEAGQEEEFSKLFNETIVQFKDDDFVMDRGFTSSVVYSKVFNRDFDLSYIDRIERELNPIVFILTGKAFDNDDIYTDKQLEIVDQEFQNLAKEKAYHLIDVTGKTVEEVHNEIVAKL